MSLLYFHNWIYVVCVQFLNAFSASFRLRALSSGGSVTSPPLSPALPKYKLADYRYGREEMLALFVKDNKVSRKRKKAWYEYVHSLVIRVSCLYYVVMDTNSYPLVEDWRDLCVFFDPSSNTLIVWFFPASEGKFLYSLDQSPCTWIALIKSIATSDWGLKSPCNPADFLAFVGFHLI